MEFTPHFAFRDLKWSQLAKKMKLSCTRGIENQKKAKNQKIDIFRNHMRHIKTPQTGQKMKMTIFCEIMLKQAHIYQKTQKNHWKLLIMERKCPFLEIIPEKRVKFLIFGHL